MQTPGQSCEREFLSRKVPDSVSTPDLDLVILRKKGNKNCGIFCWSGGNTAHLEKLNI